MNTMEWFAGVILPCAIGIGAWSAVLIGERIRRHRRQPDKSAPRGA